MIFFKHFIHYLIIIFLNVGFYIHKQYSRRSSGFSKNMYQFSQDFLTSLPKFPQNIGEFS